MFRSLANRLTLWYAAVAVGLCIIVSATYTVLGFSSVAANANQSNTQALREAADFIALSQRQHQQLSAEAPKIAAEVSRGGLRVAIIDRNGKLLGGQRPTFEAGGRGVLALMSLLGIRPHVLHFSGGLIIADPDPTRMSARLDRFWKTTIVVSIVAAIIVWLAFSGITRRALHPLVEVTTALQHFGSGEVSSRFIIDPGKRDEMAALTMAYNSAVDQVNAAFKERRSAELQMSQFIADAGHQLRTPLTVVMGFIEVLRKGTARDPETAGKIFDAMTIESRRMRTLIDRLVLLARLERGGDGSERTQFDVAALTSGVVDSFKHVPGGERLSLKAQSQALVAADKSEIHEAISNLIDNALKYSADSPVRVSVGVNDGSVTVDVRDAGPGIAREEQEKIFDRFYRGSIADGVEGSGLGLAIVKRAVERANGRLRLESSSGAGTTFEIELPRAVSANISA
ncbi:MAG: HAMP domain-containing histidine kinase [Candidatus Eremiobacteraeota bacterium]|nr:HAMP domain-containing histidine kinase [Candidatus Eremiobacteraeota bacterium]